MPHPQTPGGAVTGVHAAVARAAAGMLVVHYRIEGELERLRIPAPRPPAVGERLWQHTCCEIFIARAGMPSYLEFNFSPSGEWAAYSFQRYRDGAPFRVADPKIAFSSSPGELELHASIPGDHGKLRVALSAVIEERDGALSYWALKHPAATPDFHHPGGFALELE